MLLLVSCTPPSSSSPPSPSSPPSLPSPSSSPSPIAARALADVTPAAAAPPVAAPAATYAWGPTAADRLDRRFAEPPPGFARVDVTPGSFGAFLRTLPLLPDGAPVVDHRGNRLHDDGRHPNIAAVVDLDVGKKDLQQCADSVLRLHAEWRYGRGERDLTYRAASGQSLSYRRYLAGDRASVSGRDLALRPAAPPQKDDHAAFRQWLDEVFAWASTASLERDATKLASLSDVRAGDFFVMSGSPFGHAVLVLDVARDDRGRAALLLGQGFMPAQSFHVLRPGPGASAWFVVEPGAPAVETPFWRPFPIASLRRLGG
jgi:hypothetical protein